MAEHVPPGPPEQGPRCGICGREAPKSLADVTLVLMWATGHHTESEHDQTAGLHAPTELNAEGNLRPEQNH